ncbi:MAG: hypothetical protein AB201_01885 [Parcubacteria bacterium C7867-006]|nr:MAG: hypothetical protein AB201_01885 [Parcubacteria bacterium C7867-006]
MVIHMANLFITIKQASKILGVSPLTLRNWDNNGKLKAHRHPMNNYRVYKIEDLETVIRDIEAGTGRRISTKKEIKKLIVKHLRDDE